MDGHYDTQLKSIDGKRTTVADILEFVEEKLGLQKRNTTPFDMFIYLNGETAFLTGISFLIESLLGLRLI